MSDSRTVPIVAAVITGAATISAALIATQPWKSDDGPGPTPAPVDGSLSVPDLPGFSDPAGVFLSRDSGPGGTTVNVSGEGFSAGERIVIRFHTEQIGSTTASDQGSFSNVAITIPTSFSAFAPQQFDVIASGESSLQAARAPFTITG